MGEAAVAPRAGHLTPLVLSDAQGDAGFGSFFGHPDGPDASRLFVQRMLSEFGIGFADVARVLTSVQVPVGAKPTRVLAPLRNAMRAAGWAEQVPYPEAPARARYTADFGVTRDGRSIFFEVELSDIRRSVSALYMSRAFRTGYLRLGVLLTPDMKLGRASFYRSLATRYRYLAPDFPIWLIGFSVPPKVAVEA